MNNGSKFMIGAAAAGLAYLLLNKKTQAHDLTGALILNVFPSEAQTLINGNITVPGTYVVDPGEYSWEISLVGYITQSGLFTIESGKTTRLDITLIQEPSPEQNFSLTISPSNAVFTIEKDSGGGIQTLVSGNYILEPTKYFWICSLAGYTTQSGYFDIIESQVNALNVSLATASDLSYEILSPSFNNEGLNLIFKNNKVPTVDTSSDWNTAPVWIRFGVKVDLIKPKPSGGYNLTMEWKIVDTSPRRYKVPNTGIAAPFFVSFLDSEGENILQNLISEGYVDPNVSQIRITGVGFDNWYDCQAGYIPCNVKVSKPPTFPIIVGRE